MMCLKGLYGITDQNMFLSNQMEDKIKQALEGGMRLIQLRDKSLDQQRRLECAEWMLQLCRHYQAKLIINDDVMLAQKVGAHGVHLGGQDETIKKARKILGSQAIIGYSCYNQIENAQFAQQQGANYVAFGRFFNSTTKPEAVYAAKSILAEVKHSVHLPIVAIGGITLQNASELVTAGADMVAVIQGLFGQQDIQYTAQRFSQLF